MSPSHLPRLTSILPRRLVATAALTVCASLVPTIAHAQDQEKVGTVTQELRGGRVIVGYPGVVDFVLAATLPSASGGAPLDLSSSCTGTMIAPNVVLTAAHCFDMRREIGPAVVTHPSGALHNQSGSGHFTIFYYDPDRGRDPDPIFRGNAEWVVHPDYRGAHLVSGPGDANADLGAIVVPAPFPGTDYHDYLRIWADGASLEGHLTAYGAGLYTYSGRSDNELREAALAVESLTRNHVVVDTTHLKSICRGDSGGPLISPGLSIPAIVGIASQFERDSDPAKENCTDNTPGHDDAFYCRPNPEKMAAISGPAGLSCERLGDPQKSYLRCFDLPFIEDVPYEGLDLGLTVALLVSAML